MTEAHPVVVGFFLCGNPPPLVGGTPLLLWQSNEAGNIPRYSDCEHDNCLDAICCEHDKLLCSLVEGGLCKFAPRPRLCFCPGIPQGPNGLVTLGGPLLASAFLLLLLLLLLQELMYRGHWSCTMTSPDGKGHLKWTAACPVRAACVLKTETEDRN